jgi:hypothetical protein
MTPGIGDLWVDYRQQARDHLAALAAEAARAGAILKAAPSDARHDVKAVLERAIAQHDGAVAGYAEIDARLARLDREIADALDAVRAARTDADAAQAKAALAGAETRLLGEVTAARDAARALAGLYRVGQP